MRCSLHPPFSVVCCFSAPLGLLFSKTPHPPADIPVSNRRYVYETYETAEIRRWNSAELRWVERGYKFQTPLLYPRFRAFAALMVSHYRKSPMSREGDFGKFGVRACVCVGEGRVWKHPGARKQGMCLEFIAP